MPQKWNVEFSDKRNPLLKKDGMKFRYEIDDHNCNLPITIGNLGFIQKTKVCIKSAKKII
jgi:hypothetical protein